MSKKKLNFSQGINRLEELIMTIENSDIPLEDSIKLYKEAINISINCAESLNAAEKEVMLLQKTAAGAFEKKVFGTAAQEDEYERA